MAKIKKVMVTYEFGEPMYVSEGTLTARPSLTASKALAAIWGEYDTQTKLDYHKATTGAKELIFEDL